MRASHAAPLLGLLVAGVLASAVWGLRHERARLLDGFKEAQQTLAGEVAADVARELQALDEDARVVARLARQAPATPGHPDAAAGPAAARLGEPADDAVVRAAFDALATVVRHYRAIAVYRGDRPLVTAVDPTERGPVAAALVAGARAAAARLGAGAGAGAGAVLHGPWEAGDGRQFYAYAMASDSGAVVLVSEARLVLAQVLRPRAQNVRFFVLDPASHAWIGCAQAASCRALAPAQWGAVPGLAGWGGAASSPAGASWSAEGLAGALGLPRRSAVVAWEEIAGPAPGPWRVGLVASATAIEERERSLLWRLLATSAALVFSVGVVAALIVRHQRGALALEARLAHAQELARLRERSGSLVESVPVGILAVSKRGEVVVANRFVTERFGPVRLGAPLPSALPPALEAAAAPVAHAIERAIRTGRSQALRPEELAPLVSATSLRAAAPAQGGVQLDVRVLPLAAAVDDLGALVLVEDRSELRSLEKQLVRAEKLGTVGVLTAGIAHEIGTPLGIIRGRAETLLERAQGGPFARDLDAIILQIDQIAAVIRQVLDFARAQPVELQPTCARAAAEAALELLGWRFRQKEIRFRIAAPAELPAIAADPDQLQQVLVNLLFNAIDACAPGGQVTVSLAEAGEAPGFVRLDVTDDGCGIPPEHLHAVFDPFFTTKERGEGTGLGLSVAASIVRNHQGEVTLMSEPGGGTTVTVLWPRATPARQVAHA